MTDRAASYVVLSPPAAVSCSDFVQCREFLDEFLVERGLPPASYQRCIPAGGKLFVQWNSPEESQDVFLKTMPHGACTSLQPPFHPSALQRTADRAVVISLAHDTPVPDVKALTKVITDTIAKVEKQMVSGCRIFLLFEPGSDMPAVVKSLSEQNIPEVCVSRESWATLLAREVAWLDSLPGFAGSKESGQQGTMLTTLYDLTIPAELCVWIYYFHVECNGNLIGNKPAMTRTVESVLNEALRPHWPPKHFALTKGPMVISTVPLDDAASRETLTIERGASKYVLSVDSIKPALPVGASWVQADPESLNLVEHLLNIIFQRRCEGVLQRFGNVFLPSRKEDVVAHEEEQLMVYHAYRCEVNIRKRKEQTIFTVNVNPCRKIFNTVTVWERILEIKTRHGTDDAVFQDALQQEIVGTFVVTKYNPCLYEIRAVLMDQKPGDRMDETGDKTYASYLLERYKVEANLESCLLEASPVRGRKMQVVRLVASECLPSLEIEHGSEVPRLCTIDFRKRMAESEQMAAKIRAWLSASPAPKPEREGNFSDAFAVGIQLGEQISVPFVTLKTPVITLSGSRHVELQGDHNWGKDTKEVKYDMGLKPLYIVVLSDDSKLDAPCDKVLSLLHGAGCDIEDSTYMTTEQFLHAQELLCKKRAFPLGPKTPAGNRVVVLHLVVDGEVRAYQLVKKKCDLHGIPSQGMSTETVSPKGRKNIFPVVSNVMKQLMVKVGVMPWTVNLKDTIPVTSGIIFGIDVFHSRKKLSGSRRMPSVAGLVAFRFEFQPHSKFPTWDHLCDHSILPPGQELLDSDQKGVVLKNFALQALQRWPTPVGAVIVYRDGVGRGMLEQARCSELPQFEEVFGKSVPVTFVVVQKTIRFACSASSSSSSSLSPPPPPPPPATTTTTAASSRGSASSSSSSRTGAGACEPPQGALIEDLCEVTQFSAFMTYYLHPLAVGVSPVHHVVLSPGVFATSASLHSLKLLNYHLCFQYPTWSWSIKVPFAVQAAHRNANYIASRVKFEHTRGGGGSGSSSSSSSSSSESIEVTIKDHTIPNYF